MPKKEIALKVIPLGGLDGIGKNMTAFEYEERPDHNPERYEESAFGYGADGTEEDHHLRVDLDCGSDLVHGVVRLGRAVEQMTDDAPKRDGTTTSLHIDSKRRKKLKQKKTALGHAEDDHVDWTMEQHL